MFIAFNFCKLRTSRPGPDQQRERERRLQYDEHRASLMAAATRLMAVVLERAHEIRIRELQRRSESGDQPGDECEIERER